MNYQLIQGPSEKKIIEQCIRAGWSLPEKIANAPSILPGLELYYIGFIDLMSSRQVGMAPGPIWWTTIQEYCEKRQLDEDQTDTMHIHISALDALYLKQATKK